MGESAGFAEQLRLAITASGKTKYRLALETGIFQGNLGRFMAGKCGLSIRSVGLVCANLGLKLTATAKAVTVKAVTVKAVAVLPVAVKPVAAKVVHPAKHVLTRAEQIEQRYGGGAMSVKIDVPQ